MSQTTENAKKPRPAIVALENDMADLRATVLSLHPVRKDWRSTFGTLPHDDLSRESRPPGPRIPSATARALRRRARSRHEPLCGSFAAGSEAGARLAMRIGLGSEETATTIVCAEETLRGWAGRAAPALESTRANRAHRTARPIEFFAAWLVLPGIRMAADRFIRLRRDGVRVGTMDLKIACITLAHDATLLTRNTGDFAKSAGIEIRELAGLKFSARHRGTLRSPHAWAPAVVEFATVVGIGSPGKSRLETA